MKRLRRIIFNALTVLSLLLCVATVAIWVRSYWREDSVSRYDKSGTFVIESGRGGMSFERLTLTHSIQSGWRWASGSQPRDRRERTERWFAGFGYRNRWFRLWKVRDIAVPYWAILLLSAVLPAVWYRVFRRSPRQGCCLVCQYDLRATPDCCPECGTVPKKLEKISN